MRVGVAFARRTVGGPAGVGDPQATDQRLAGQGLFQFADLAWAAYTLQLAGVGEERHTGTVVTAVFQALKAFEQNGGNVSFSNRANNSTHGFSPR